jgi:hypothetical protein
VSSIRVYTCTHFDLEDGSNMDLRNVVKTVHNHTVLNTDFNSESGESIYASIVSNTA